MPFSASIPVVLFRSPRSGEGPEDLHSSFVFVIWRRLPIIGQEFYHQMGEAFLSNQGYVFSCFFNPPTLIIAHILQSLNLCEHNSDEQC